MANRVTKQYPDPGTDWRGIAMLTQQMSELFKPSKSRLLSQQQDHEMKMLQAKEAWKFGSEQLKQNKALYQQALKDVDIAQEKLVPFGQDLMKASLTDGAMPENASKMLDDTQGRSVRDLNDLAIKYHNETLRIQKNLDSMEELNRHAEFGETFGKKYRGKGGSKNYLKEFNVEPNTPGIISSDERENIKYARLMDMYHVPDEELETAEYITENAAGKDINVRPEAAAWIAGFDMADDPEARLQTETVATVKAEPVDLEKYYALDANYMNLSQEDRDAINTALTDITGVQKLDPGLMDTYEQMKAMNKLTVSIAETGKGDLINPLPDSVFEVARDAKWYKHKSKEGVIQKPWAEIDINGKKDPGLTKDLYDSLRKLGYKASQPRAALEFVIRNWESRTPEQWAPFIVQVKAQHDALIGIK